MAWMMTMLRDISTPITDTELVHNLSEHEFLDIMDRMLGPDGLEQANRTFYSKHGWDASNDTFMKSRIFLLARALENHELRGYTVRVEDSKSVQITWHSDEDGVLFRLKWMKR